MMVGGNLEIATFNISSDFLNFNKENGEEEFKTIIGVIVVISAATGVLANFLIILLSFGHVRGDFRLFVANLAFVDSICGFVFMFMGYINVNKNHHIPSQFLYYMTLAYYGSFGIMICAIVPISLSRISALSKTVLYYDLFNHRNIVFLGVFLDILPIIILSLICTVDHDIAKILFYAFATITTLAYLIAFTTNCMVFRVVGEVALFIVILDISTAKHIRVVENLKDQVRLLETRQVAIATFAQAIIPLICQVPAFLTLSSLLLLSEPITNGHVIIITQLWLALSPLLDAIITIIVIKQYRKNCLTFTRKIINKLWSSQQKKNVVNGYEKGVLETEL